MMDRVFSGRRHGACPWICRRISGPPGIARTPPVGHRRPIQPIREPPASITIGHLQPVVALLCGILILLVPRLLNYIVAIYLIVVGIIGLGIFK